MRLVLFSTLFFLSKASYSSCEPMRLDQKNGAMERIPVYDQGNLNVCYGYAVSQIIDAYRFSHGEEDFDHLTSPVAVSVFYSVGKDKGSVEFGNTRDAIPTVLKNGSCKYGSVFKKIGNIDYEDYFEELEDSYDDFKALGKRSLFRLFSPKTSEEVVNNILELVHDKRASESVLGAHEILSALDSPTYLVFLKRLFGVLCNDSQKDLKLSVTQHSKFARDFNSQSRTENLIESINMAWDTKNPQPVGISYCEDFLYNKDHVGIDDEGKVSSRCRTHHASVVIGRRPSKDGKNCQFLIRNSKGDSCSNYEWDCENGQIWVDQKALGRNIYYTTWLE